MQLGKPLLAALFALGLAVTAGPAFGQSLAPMRGEGPTPSAAKAFRLTITNPYDQRMTFVVEPMEPGFVKLAGGSAVHQHGSRAPSVIAHPNSAPQRVQILIPDKVPIAAIKYNRTPPFPHKVYAVFTAFACKISRHLFRTLHERSSEQPQDRRPT